MNSSRKPAVKAVWTDFGGVVTPPISHTMESFCTRKDIDRDALFMAIIKVTESYGTDDYMEPIDTPLVTEREWLRQIGDILVAEHGLQGEYPTTLADDWFDGRETNHAWVEVLRGLRARGLFVGMLSNMVPTWDAHWRRMVDAGELFDDVVLSFEVGHRKPQRGMYDLAAKRAGVRPEECLLVDDTARNVEGARAASWQAVHFIDAESAGAELARLLDP
ncbi:putative hydrolase of the HAD superfamily [Thermomonospora echinospora]|uniref:Putative hydrolase of the HAD superfamily n=1 Tax=Thermomonospora echinospora TaxID=1992 RepID=A0A1H5VEY4_9ACTN|nr:HAD family phosphatase [Thermomonospora echinospora]SEF85912.1 putative hydrolase of the HAD superfamily [Thermomonospora echinospora]